MPSWAQDALKLFQGPTAIRGSQSLNGTKAAQDVDTRVTRDACVIKTCFINVSYLAICCTRALLFIKHLPSVLPLLCLGKLS